MKDILKIKGVLIFNIAIFIAIILMASISISIINAQSPNTLFTEFSPPVNGSNPYDITSSQDGNIWFTESGGGKIGRITSSGQITEFTVRTNTSGISHPFDITVDPDNNIWYTETTDLGLNKIGKFSQDGNITEYTIPSNDVSYGITIGPDGNIWITEYNVGRIARLTPSGEFTEFTIPTANSKPYGITSGADGNVWFTETNANKIGRITPEGIISEFSIPTNDSRPQGITSGPDGNIWFTEWDGGKVGRITPTGVFTEFQSPTSNSFLYGITSGPDGNIWFTEPNVNKIGLLNLSYISLPSPTPQVGHLSVPLLKQGIPPFSNNDPAWEGNEYDHGNSQFLWCGNTIAACGCATTSIAMILRYHNIVNPANGALSTPSTVNDYFNRNSQCGKNGCISLGYFFGDVRWTAVNNYAAEAHRNYNTQKIIYDGGGGYDASVVTQEINNEQPVILGVPNHWIVATGISNDTFTINDPLYSRTLLSDPAYGNTASQGMRRYKKTNSDFSGIEVAVKTPAHVIITDPSGNKTGYDTNLPSIVNNIPNSSYFFDEALADDTGLRPTPSPNAGVYWVIVQTPQAGSYQIDVIGSTNQSYSIAVYGSDRDANVNFKLFEGQQTATTPNHYSFEYNPVPNDTPIFLQVPIEIKPDGNSNIINPKSNGLIRIALMSTAVFDARSVNPPTLKLGPSGASANSIYQTIDVNGDKRPDRVYYFRINEIGLESGDTRVCLTGKTPDGFDIKGCTIIRTVP